MNLNWLSFSLSLPVSLPSNTRKITNWHDGITFPAQHGLSQSLGVAGSFAGFLGQYLIVAGGSNFPRGSSVHGGQKEFCDDLFIFEVKESGELVKVGHKLLPQKIASGLTVGTEEGLFLIGGENLADDCSQIWHVTLSGTTAKVEQVGNLPFTWASGAGALHQGRLYLFGGKIDGLPSAQSFVCDLDGSNCEELAPFPAAPRLQMSYAMCGNSVYLFHGFSGAIAETDGYIYDFAQDSWKALPELRHGPQAYTAAGGSAVAISEEEILLFGGVNKQIFEHAAGQMGRLKDQQFQAFREKYLAQSAEEFKFNNKFFLYNTRTRLFSYMGDAPFSGLAGCFPMLFRDGYLWIVSGEVKPEVRMPSIKVGKIE